MQAVCLAQINKLTGQLKRLRRVHCCLLRSLNGFTFETGGMQAAAEKLDAEIKFYAL